MNMRLVLGVVLLFIMTASASDKCFDFRVCESELLHASEVTKITADSMLCRYDYDVEMVQIKTKINGVPVTKIKSYNGLVCRKVALMRESYNGGIVVTYSATKIKRDNFPADVLMELTEKEGFKCEENFFYSVGCNKYVAVGERNKFIGSIDDDLNVSGYCYLPNGKKKHVSNIDACWTI